MRNHMLSAELVMLLTMMVLSGVTELLGMFVNK